MRRPLHVPPAISSAPLSSAQLTPPPFASLCAETSYISRAGIEARISACRACEHVAHVVGGCSACDLRCVHPEAKAMSQLLALRSSLCPADRWAAIP